MAASRTLIGRNVPLFDLPNGRFDQITKQPLTPKFSVSNTSEAVASKDKDAA